MDELEVAMRIIVVAGPDEGRSFPLTEGELALVGRGDACALKLSDPSVSRVHCRVLWRGRTIELTDADSRFGTEFAGNMVNRAILTPGDEFETGETVMRIEPASSPLTTTIVPRKRNPGGVNRPGESAKPPAENDGRQGVGSPLNDDSPASGVGLRMFSPDEFIGSRYLSFDVRALAAEARTGYVFDATDVKHDRRVALKLFQPDVLDARSDQRRFLRAVRTMIPLKHENLVHLYAAGRHDSICFTASEWVEGESAAEMIQRIGVGGMLDWENVYRIGLDVARALEFASERSIVHRNITPRNILVRADDRTAKLGDLMLAKALSGSSAEQITGCGELIGELAYLAPEQLADQDVIDARTDLYSLGATLYALLTSRPPFEGATPAETISAVLSPSEPDPPTQRHLSIPTLFEGVVLRMLAFRPDDRPQDARALVTELERVGRYCGLS